MKKLAPNSVAPQGFPNTLRPRSIRCVHSKAWSPTKIAPPSAVRSKNIFARGRLEAWRASSDFTIVTLEQMRRNVIRAVSWMPSTEAGCGQSTLVARMAPYEASRTPKPTASPARKIHIPSLPQLSGVRGDSAGSTAGWCSAVAASLTIRSPSVRSYEVDEHVQDGPEGHDEVPVDGAAVQRHVALRREPPAAGEPQHPAEPGGRAEHVGAVHADQCVEGRAVDARRHPEPEADEARPLDALDEQEEDAEPPGPSEPAHEPCPIAGPDHPERPHERPARAEEDERVQRGQADGQSRLAQGRPHRRLQAKLEECDHEPSEEHDLPAEEHQHPQAGIREGPAIRAGPRVVVAVAVVAVRGSRGPAAPVRHRIRAARAAPDLEVEGGHESPQFLSQATTTDTSTRTTIQATRIRAVRRLRPVR